MQRHVTELGKQSDYTGYVSFNHHLALTAMAQAEASANFDEVYTYVDIVNSNLVGFPVFFGASFVDSLPFSGMLYMQASLQASAFLITRNV